MKSLKLFLNYFSVSILVFFAQVCFTQDLCFFAKDTVGCAPFKIEIHDCGLKIKDGKPLPTNYTFDEGKTFTSDSVFTFQTKGSYAIWQFKGFGTIDTLIKSNHITVLDDPEPVFTLSACADFVIHVQINHDDYDKYIVSYDHTFPNDTILGNASIEKKFNDNALVNISVKGIYDEAECFNTTNQSITPIEDIIQPNIDSLINTNPTTSTIYFTQHPFHSYTLFSSTDNSSFSEESDFSDNTTFYTWNNSSSKSIYIKTSDACENSKFSDSIATISLSGTAENTVNKLISESLSANTHAVIRDNNNITSSSSKTYNDTDISCGENYKYYIQENVNGSIVKSNSISLKAISTNTPAPLNNFYTSVQNNKLTFNWSNQSVKTLHIYNENLVLQASLPANGNNFASSSFSPTTGTCFYANYTDICDNKSNDSDTIKSCNSILTHQQNFTNNFEWTPYLGINSVKHYTIEWYNQSFNLLEALNVNSTINHSSDLIFAPSQNYNVRVKITLNNDSIAYTNYVYIEQEPIIKFPTAFSPNNDGLNDTFKPLHLFVKEYNMIILTPDNEILYEGKEWDGNTEAHKFSYLIEYTDQNNKTSQKSGSGLIVK